MTAAPALRLGARSASTPPATGDPLPPTPARVPKSRRRLLPPRIGAPLLSSRLLPPSTLAERKAVPLASPSPYPTRARRASLPHLKLGPFAPPVRHSTPPPARDPTARRFRDRGASKLLHRTTCLDRRPRRLPDRHQTVKDLYNGIREHADQDAAMQGGKWLWTKRRMADHPILSLTTGSIRPQVMDDLTLTSR
ncbi:uncharacterized protein LOC120682387 isoform X2 [Panicum virgatum]|uniref:Uncharacterized protein n=1 Tax=Panicum virgatum TaxID=38727 RepID=A0A8T0Q511_PANVG|nr:uncharacterized protein LOC120682387 isoform X2 [Panicum virgatum]KAG2565394.1 hypothetical protein PVAP13_7NG020117 [Panicum virgatum]